MKFIKILIKLKILKLIYIYKINLFKDANLNIILNRYLNYCNEKIMFTSINSLFSNNLVKYNLIFFKNQTFNQFFFYNYNLINSIKNCKIQYNSNYNFKYLFFYFLNNKLKTQNNNNISNIYLNNLFFIKYFIAKFIYSYLFNKNLLINFDKNKLNLHNKLYNSDLILTKIRRFFTLRELNINPKTFLDLILAFFYTKDVIFFKNLIKYILENTHFKNHKKFLYNLKVLLSLIFDVYSSTFNVLGVYIKVKGKIGLGGNSKTKKYNFKKGKFSFTKKDQKLNYNKDVIRTYSGVLGFEIYLTYL